MASYEVLAIVRDAKRVPVELTCAIETPDLEFLCVGGADIGLSTERVKRGFVLSLSRAKIYPRAPGTRIEVTRMLRGDIRSARLVIQPDDLKFVEPDDRLLEKTTTRVANELIVRFTAKKGSDGVRS